MSTLLIKNGYLLTMDDMGSRFYGDVYIEDDRIAAIGADLKQRADKTIDASDMLVMPGFIQTHIHLCQSHFL